MLRIKCVVTHATTTTTTTTTTNRRTDDDDGQRQQVHAGAVGAIAMVSSAARFVINLRGFQLTAHYVRTVTEILKFSGMFLVILVVFSVGCGWSFMLLFGGYAEVAEKINVDVSSEMCVRCVCVCACV